MNKLNLSNLLSEQIKPAMGCTEPAAIAIACANAASTLMKYSGAKTKDIKNIELTLDRFVYRNAKAVGIPQSGGKTGIKTAAAMGIFCNPNYGLNIFSSFNKGHIAKAEKIAEKVIINISGSKPLYIKAKVTAGKNYSVVIIKNFHMDIEKIESNRKIIFRNENKEHRGLSSEMENISGMNIKEIISAAKNAQKDNFETIKNLIGTNWTAAQYGIKNRCGLGIGANIMRLCNKKGELEGYVQAMASAATDARMSGEYIEIISVCGSGNQGIMCSVPIKAAGKILDINEKRIIAAVLIAVLIECNLTSKFGYLTDLCGAVTKAGFAATAGLTYLLCGNEKQIENALNIFAGDLTGVICDGAKSGCALKICSSSSSAVRAALLSLKGVSAPADCGIIGNGFKETIENISRNNYKKTNANK